MCVTAPYFIISVCFPLRKYQISRGVCCTCLCAIHEHSQGMQLKIRKNITQQTRKKRFFQRARFFQVMVEFVCFPIRFCTFLFVVGYQNSWESGHFVTTHNQGMQTPRICIVLGASFRSRFSENAGSGKRSL